jgi:hypothetical protein
MSEENKATIRIGCTRRSIRATRRVSSNDYPSNAYGGAVGSRPVISRSRSDRCVGGQRTGRNPASVTSTSRRTAALDGKLLAAVRAWRQ